MITGRFNIVLGLVAMILAGITGFALGLTLERYFQNGYAQITFWRQLTRVGHTHGMPFGLINVLFGLIIGRATCSNRLKRLGAVFTAPALCLPLGTALRGLTEGAPWAKGLAILGRASLLSAVCMRHHDHCRECQPEGVTVLHRLAFNFGPGLRSRGLAPAVVRGWPLTIPGLAGASFRHRRAPYLSNESWGRRW